MKSSVASYNVNKSIRFDAVADLVGGTTNHKFLLVLANGEKRGKTGLHVGLRYKFLEVSPLLTY